MPGFVQIDLGGSRRAATLSKRTSVPPRFAATKSPKPTNSNQESVSLVTAIPRPFTERVSVVTHSASGASREGHHSSTQSPRIRLLTPSPAIAVAVELCARAASGVLAFRLSLRILQAPPGEMTKA